jgi:hypothetical protein
MDTDISRPRWLNGIIVSLVSLLIVSSCMIAEIYVNTAIEGNPSGQIFMSAMLYKRTQECSADHPRACMQDMCTTFNKSDKVYLQSDDLILGEDPYKNSIIIASIASAYIGSILLFLIYVLVKKIKGDTRLDGWVNKFTVVFHIFLICWMILTVALSGSVQRLKSLVLIVASMLTFGHVVNIIPDVCE